MELPPLGQMIRTGLLRRAVEHRWLFVNAAQDGEALEFVILRKAVSDRIRRIAVSRSMSDIYAGE